MNLKSWLAAGAVVTSIVGVFGLSGCSRGPNISPLSIGKSDKFCVDAATFQAQAAALEVAAAQGDLASLQKAAGTARDGLVLLQQDAAKFPDKVNGHLVKDDVATAVSTYASVTTELNAANASDPGAIQKALAKVQAKDGQAFTQATGRLDAYTKKICGLVVSNATTTTVATTVAPAPSTSVGTGVTSSVPTTAAGGSTVVGPTGPVGPVGPTTTPPAP